MEEKYLPVATSDAVFFIMADTSPEVLLRLGLVALAVAVLIAAAVLAVVVVAGRAARKRKD